MATVTRLDGVRSGTTGMTKQTNETSRVAQRAKRTAEEPEPSAVPGISVRDGSATLLLPRLVLSSQPFPAAYSSVCGDFAGAIGRCASTGALRQTMMMSVGATFRVRGDGERAAPAGDGDDEAQEIQDSAAITAMSPGTTSTNSSAVPSVPMPRGT